MEDRESGEVAVYSSAGITGWHNKPIVKGKGIIVGRKGTVGSVYYADMPFYCIDTAYYIKEDENKYDLNFLYYYLKYLRLDRLNEDSAVPGLNRDNAYLQDIYLPNNIPEQKQVSRILSVLDDKIDLLRRQNETLEAIAQTLFKRWFVEFEFPDENGRPYKSSGGKMVSSELGEIPEGWRVGKIKDLGNVVCGKTPSKARIEYFNGDIPFIKIPDMHGTVFVFDTEDTLSEKGANSQQTKFLPAYSINVSCIATVGLVTINSKASHTNQQINSIIPINEFYLEYLFFSLKSLSNYLKSIGSGGSATLNHN